jgi:hypothetical protein
MHVRKIVAVGLLGAMLVGCASASTPTPAPAKPAEVPKSAAAAPAPAVAPTRPAAAAPIDAARPAAGAGMTAPAAAARNSGDTFAGAPAAAPPAASQPATETKSELAQTTIGPEATAWLDRKIIRNATLSIWTQTVDAKVQEVRQIAQQNGGFISASNTRTEKVKVNGEDQERQIAVLTLQVPVQQFDPTISALRNLGKVENEVGTSQDVTEEFVDLSANVANLRKTEEAVSGMLAKATRLEDVMMLTRELTQIRGQIERIEGRKRFLDKRAELSSVTLTLQPPPPAAVTPTPTPVPTPVPVWDPSRTAERGWNASLRVLRGVADVAILALAFGWWLIPLGAIGGAIALRMRRPAARETSAEA